MIHFKNILAAMLLHLTISSSAQSSIILYGVDDTTDQLIQIDPLTGVGTAIGSTGISRVSGIAIDSDGTIFASRSDTDELYTINKSTGAASLIGSLGFTNVLDLAFDSNGTLYGIDDGLDRLLTINTATGAATSVATLANTNLAGMAFDASDKLYTTDFIDGNLLEINPTNGNLTLIGSFEIGSNSIGSIDFNQNGTLFGSDFGASDSLYTINTNTGEATLVGPYGFSTVYAVAFDTSSVPEPSSFLAMLIALGAFPLFFKIQQLHTTGNKKFK